MTDATTVIDIAAAAPPPSPPPPPATATTTTAITTTTNELISTTSVTATLTASLCGPAVLSASSSPKKKKTAESETERERSILIVGKAGSGKSSLGNLLLGKAHFTSSAAGVVQGEAKQDLVTLKVPSYVSFR